MTILGIGIDLLHLPRFQGLVDRRTLAVVAKRILSPPEHEAFRSSADPTRFLAVRWAIKEAAYKALSPEIRLTWKDVALLADRGSSKPELQIYTPDAKGLRLHCSVSHDGEYVAAHVLAEQRAAM